MSESLVAKRKLTVNDVYKNLAANCYAVENKLVELVIIITNYNYIKF